MTTATKRVRRDAQLRWVPIEDMRVNPLAQRELNQSWVDEMAANFDPEEIGRPIVNLRDGAYYIIDGQHRIELLKAVGWGDQSVHCDTYEGLTEQEEAEKFLKYNNVRTVPSLPKFRVAVTAERSDEVEIDRVVRAQGLCVTRDKVPGAIGAVSALCKVYGDSDGFTLGRTLRIVRDAYGDIGLQSSVIRGVGLVCQRYNGQLKDDVAVERLQSAHGGIAGLLNRADHLHRSTGKQQAQCVAAAAVDIINRGRGGKKLPDWWKS